MSQSISYATDFASKLEEVHKALKAVADRDTKFLSMFLKLNDPVNNNKFEWVDKTLVGFKDALSAVLSTTNGTTITVASGTNAPKRYIDGVTLIRVDDEVLLVNSTITVVTNASSYNVTRAQLGTTAATHANAAQVILIGNPRAEGFNAGRDDSQRGVRKFNYTQIFERQLKLSGSSQEIQSVSDEMALKSQAKELTPELLKEIQNTLVHGIRYANDSTNYTDRKMGGFYYWATQGGGTNTNAANNFIDTSMIDGVIEAYLNNGGDAEKLCMAVSIKQQRKINDLKEARVIGGGHMQSDNTINNFVNRYDFGSRASVEIIPVTDLKDDEIYFFQKDLISVHPLGSRSLMKKSLPEDGDFKRELLIGEYTAVFRNVRETLFRFYNLGLPA